MEKEDNPLCVQCGKPLKRQTVIYRDAATVFQFYNYYCEEPDCPNYKLLQAP
jgi:hypothetical protein